MLERGSEKLIKCLCIKNCSNFFNCTFCLSDLQYVSSIRNPVIHQCTKCIKFTVLIPGGRFGPGQVRFRLGT